jgi:superoxide oxidase
MTSHTLNDQNAASASYAPLMMAMHWIIAILIVLAYLFINLKGLFVKGSDPRELMKTLHFMMGLSMFFLLFVRIYVKLTSTKPAIVPAIPRWQLVTSNVTHLMLYAFMITMPILGWLTLSAAGKPVPFFGQKLPALINEHKETAKSLKELHKTIGTLGYYLIALHTGATLFHHYIRKDNTLLRILPWSKRTLPWSKKI